MGIKNLRAMSGCVVDIRCPDTAEQDLVSRNEFSIHRASPPEQDHLLSDDTEALTGSFALSLEMGAKPRRRRTIGSEYSSAAGAAPGELGRAVTLPGQLRPVASTAF